MTEENLIAADIEQDVLEVVIAVVVEDDSRAVDAGTDGRVELGRIETGLTFRNSIIGSDDLFRF